MGEDSYELLDYFTIKPYKFDDVLGLFNKFI